MVRGQSLVVKGSRFAAGGRRTGVTWDGRQIWIDLVRGVGRGFGVAVAWTLDRDGWVPSFQVIFIQRSSSAFHIVSEDIQKYWEMIRPQRPVIDLR